MENTYAEVVNNINVEVSNGIEVVKKRLIYKFINFTELVPINVKQLRMLLDHFNILSQSSQMS